MTFQDGQSPIEVNSGPVAVGNVPTGTRDVSPVEITVPEKLEPGVYELPVEYEYAYTRVAEFNTQSAEYIDLTRTQTATLTIEVDDKPQFEVVDVDSDAQIGDRKDVSITLENTGTEPARDASVTARSGTGQLSFGTGQSQSSTGYVGAWEPGEAKTVTYRTSLTPDAPHRSYAADVTVAYTDTNGIDQTSEQLTAGISTAAEQSFALENVSSTLRVGEDGEIMGTVTNTGPNAVDSTVVRFTDQDSPNVIPIEQSVAVGALEAGESASFELPIEVSGEAEAGSKSFDFGVQYRNSDDEKRQYDKLSVVTAVAAGARSVRRRYRRDDDRRWQRAGAHCRGHEQPQPDSDRRRSAYLCRRSAQHR
ncbi:COG1361 S-layer family protein [Natrinema hispanicum]|uniref:COG1361 S-layer family protein n=1 Tax=Natrinema hispanicum TaxID=392421 RepID=UPI001F5FF01A|nr:COG1361 S-layer family protein [Natrinema hispanicum]